MDTGKCADCMFWKRTGMNGVGICAALHLGITTKPRSKDPDQTTFYTFATFGCSSLHERRPDGQEDKNRRG